MKKLAALLLVAACAWAEAPVAPPLKGRVIVLDPGHAVLNETGAIINPGARARHGAYERDVALAVTEKVVPLLEAQGAKVYVTRTHDNPWRVSPRKQADNRARAIFANVMRAQAYVRVHCDWNRDRRFKGFTTYYFRWGSRDLAKTLDQALAATLVDHKNNGIHRRSFVSITARMPAVLLEIGVLSHKPEGKEMESDAYQSRVAQAIADGLVNYFAHVS